MGYHGKVRFNIFFCVSVCLPFSLFAAMAENVLPAATVPVKATTKRWQNSGQFCFWLTAQAYIVRCSRFPTYRCSSLAFVFIILRK